MRTATKTFLKIHFEFAYFSFFLTHLDLKQIRSYTPEIPWKPYPIPDQSEQNLYPFSDQNGAKTLPFGGGHGLCRGEAHPTITTKRHSSHKCCIAALCNNRFDDRKDLPSYVFPNDPCRRLASPLSPIQCTQRSWWIQTRASLGYGRLV